MDAASAHIAGSPMTFGLPGMHVKPLLPSRRTTVFPFESVSTILADFATSAGPADIARAILACVVSPATIVERSSAVCAPAVPRGFVPFTKSTPAESVTNPRLRVSKFIGFIILIVPGSSRPDSPLFWFELLRSLYFHCCWASMTYVDKSEREGRIPHSQSGQNASFTHRMRIASLKLQRKGAARQADRCARSSLATPAFVPPRHRLLDGRLSGEHD